MRFGLRNFGIAVATLMLGAGLTVSAAFAAKGQTFTGRVSDAMCGAKHAMAGSPAECTRACVAKGANYALVVDDKVYTLDSKDKAALDAYVQHPAHQALLAWLVPLIDAIELDLRA